jgi:hypothetical protein
MSSPSSTADTATIATLRSRISDWKGAIKPHLFNFDPSAFVDCVVFWNRYNQKNYPKTRTPRKYEFQGQFNAFIRSIQKCHDLLAFEEGASFETYFHVPSEFTIFERLIEIWALIDFYFEEIVRLNPAGFPPLCLSPPSYCLSPLDTAAVLAGNTEFMKNKKCGYFGKRVLCKL